MNDQETESKIEEKSTTPSTDTSGSDWEVKDESPASEVVEPPPEQPSWEVNSTDSENLLDGPNGPVEDELKCVGEFRVLLFEDETVRVEFPNLGRWTPGRIEKAMSRIFRENIIQRQKEFRRLQGEPAEFNMGMEVSDNG